MPKSMYAKKFRAARFKTGPAADRKREKELFKRLKIVNDSIDDLAELWTQRDKTRSRTDPLQVRTAEQVRNLRAQRDDLFDALQRVMKRTRPNTILIGRQEKYF